MIFHDIQQNTDEWYDIRVGKVTTSKFGVFMANYGRCFGDPAKKYAFKIAKEQVTGEKIEEDTYYSKNMENGHIYEPIAIERYEIETFETVNNGGFCQHSTLKGVGGSPDGLVGVNGGIEVKSVTDWTHLKTIQRKSFDPTYKWQLLGNMWLCDLDWIDFISYGITYTEDKKLFVHRLNRCDYENELKKIDNRLFDFLELIEDYKKYL